MSVPQRQLCEIGARAQRPPSKESDFVHNGKTTMMACGGLKQVDRFVGIRDLKKCEPPLPRSCRPRQRPNSPSKGLQP
jgi:hypothetical protein